MNAVIALVWVFMTFWTGAGAVGAIRLALAAKPKSSEFRSLSRSSRIAIAVVVTLLVAACVMQTATYANYVMHGYWNREP